jgi:hypothetical protein
MYVQRNKTNFRVLSKTIAQALSSMREKKRSQNSSLDHEHRPDDPDLASSAEERSTGRMIPQR